MNKLKTLAGETALYGLGSMLPRMLNFLLVPLHTINMFSRAEYGEITKLLSIVAFVNVVYMFGMETAFFRFATKPGSDPRRIFNLAQTCVLLISIPLSVVFIVFAPVIAPKLGIGAHPEFIQWLALIMLIDATVAIPFAQLRLQKRPVLFASAKLINVLVLMALNYYFLKLNFDPAVGIGYVFLANLLANALYILFFIKTLAHYRPAFDKTLSPAMLQYAYPVMLTGVAGMTNEMFSRLTLDWWLPENFYGSISNEDALGVFGASYKYAVFMNLGIQAFRYAAEPFFFSHSTSKDSPALFAKVNHFFTIAGCFVLLAVALNLDLFQYLIGNEFRMGLTIVPILLLAYLCLGIYYNMSIWFKLTDRTYMGTLITVMGAILTIAANYWLIPLYGYTGSSYAALICYASMMGACYLLGQKYHPIPYKLTGGLLYVLLAFLLLWGSSLLPPAQQWVQTAEHGAIMALFLLVAYRRERSYWKAAA
jgi:O-antigen/teichoic acid export membrane protein